MLSQQEPKMIQRQYNFKCEKCGKAFETARNLRRHTDKKNACDLYINNIDDAVIQTDIIENAVSHTDFKLLTDKMDNGFKLLNDKIDILMSLLMKKEESVNSVNSVINSVNPVNPVNPVEKIKKVKKVKKTPAPTFKYTIVPPTTETEVDMSLSVQPVQQAPVLTTIPINENPIEYLTKTYEPTDTIYGNLNYICKDLQEEWFEKCEDEDLKFYIKDDKCREFIDKCSTIEKKEAFYAILFEEHLKYNYELGVLSFYDYKTEQLYVINEDMDWELSTTNTTNPIACLLWDKLNTAVAFTAKFNPDLANDLFKIKRLVSKNEKINEIVKSVLSTVNYDKRVSIYTYNVDGKL